MSSNIEIFAVYPENRWWRGDDVISAANDAIANDSAWWCDACGRDARECGVASHEARPDFEPVADLEAAIFVLQDKGLVTFTTRRRTAGGGRTERRPSMTPPERWAADALATLAASDPDRARELNGAGFCRRDGEIGHSLAAQLAAGRGLTDHQWDVAVRMCRKYHRQVGRPPGEDRTSRVGDPIDRLTTDDSPADAYDAHGVGSGSQEAARG